MASPATHPARPSKWIDPRRPGDYPIVLGDSLKGDSKSKDALLGIRYNWQPKSGFDSHESKLERSGDKYQLVIPDSDSDEYRYSGHLNSPDDASSSFALVFNRSKPVPTFVLESLSTRLDMNLKSAPDLSSKEARNLPQLPTSQESSARAEQSNGDGGTSPYADDETADDSNPYDFRHFLNEARENLEKATLQSGNRTPIPGSRTPMSGVSTPAAGVAGASRAQATTPQFRPTPATSKPTPQRKKKTEDISRGPSRPPATKPAAKRDHAKGGSAQPLSKERISDSDEDDDEDEPLSTRPSSKPSAPAPKDTGKSRPSHLAGKGHNRNVSANIGRSPHIIINDDDLEIDMGSPPPESGRRRGRVDPEMFRSHTATPIAGHSSNAQSKPASRAVEEPRRSGHRDRDADVTMKDIEAGSSDEDGDVEEFELGSPRDKRLSVPHSGSVSRMEEDEDEEDDDHEHDAHRRRQPQPVHAPTPPAPITAYDDDDDLEAALEAALEEEDEDEGGGIGLGIGVSTQDDESEVSEEE